ncbi:NB-ARC domain containing protein [Parasponia andersonii]|uniref:NB-ARC domain containing protein n=1 Tax=Parasponia andersonii TaxID=3476 RepID=A0A2P5AUF3_PARAD|nr:NB-ARC domain containing protein [Parasponia andersonii]
MEYIEAGVSIAGQVIKYTDFDEKMQRLKRKLEVLESREEDVSNELKYAEQLLFKKRRKTVENWLNNVKSIKNQMQELESRVEGSSSVTRPLVLGKRMDTLAEEVSEFIQEGQSFPNGLTCQAPENGVALLTRRLEGEIIQKLQNDIAETVLHFKFSNEDDETKRAGELAVTLSKKEDFDLIFDDVWDDFELDEVGIPFSVGGCKFYNRSFAGEKLGNTITLSPEIERIAKCLARECDGLPLGIIVMARSMRGVDNICEWSNALDKMKESKVGQDDMERKLENACLLEGETDKKGKKYVKMHDLLRDMAIQIASMSGGFLVEAGLGLKDFPEKEKWTEYLVRASLMYNNLSNIPSNLSPRCPRLVTLWLDKNIRLTYIPDCFFIHMSMLAHLDLSDAQIEYLPTSISDLENLVSLLLNRCLRLKSIPPLGKRMRLQALDLSDTKITEVPEGVDTLINVRYLNLDTKGRLMIPDGFFSELSCLQFLVFYHFNLCTLELKGQEIARLRKLETFKGQFCDVDNFRKCKTSEARAGNESLVLPTDVKTLIIRECKDVTCLCDIASLKTVTDLRKLKTRDCSGMQNMLCPSCCKLYHLQSLEELYIQDFKDWSVSLKEGYLQI